MRAMTCVVKTLLDATSTKVHTVLLRCIPFCSHRLLPGLETVKSVGVQVDKVNRSW